MERMMPIAVAAPLLSLAQPALAHNGSGDLTGIMHYLLHAIAGVDPVLTLVAMGVVAAWLGRRLRADSTSPSTRRSRPRRSR